MKMRKSLPMLTIIDVEMPGKNGFDTLEEIKGDGSLAGACVCLMTGTLTDEVRKRADELGASGCLGKPLNAAELAEMIKYAKIQNGGNRI
jgi:DNA-binding response OmpR family regulator